MAKPFHEVRERLLRAGVAPRHVRRYLIELGDHLADLIAEEEGAGRSRADAESAALLRIGTIDDLTRAMIEQRQFQSWSARAPWATFGLVPLFVLAAAWIIALFILWSGWNIFLPGAATPFIRIHGLAILYFGVGRMIYLGAPILVGWGIGIIAARQRLKAAWPVVGCTLIAVIGGVGQVHVSEPVGHAGVRHVGMGFTLASSVQGNPYGLMHGLYILALTTLPYLIWQFHQAHSFSAQRS